jgi:hypothetical protein
MKGTTEETKANYGGFKLRLIALFSSNDIKHRPIFLVNRSYVDVIYLQFYDLR